MSSSVKSIQWPGKTISAIEVYHTIPSTNSFAKDRIKSDCPTGTVIWALNQTQGRGRRGREWKSDNSSLAISIAWSWPSRESLGILPLMIGLGLVQEFKSLIPDVKVKWPNDLWVGERKLGGILLETIRFNKTLWVIAGIGLNVNRSVQFSSGLWVSMEELTGVSWCRLGILDRVLVGVERARALHNEEHQDLTGLFRIHGNFLDRPIMIIQGDRSSEVKAQKVLHDGRLLVEDAHGQKVVLPDEISLRF